jgi:hypothetical protein
MEPPIIKHVRYEDFIALVSDGVNTLDGFRAAIDHLLAEMGSVRAHHVLFDLRHATVGPLRGAVLIEGLSFMSRRGLGLDNRMALLTDRDDTVRTERALAAERAAAHMGLHVRAFTDHSDAMDWLNSPAA